MSDCTSESCSTGGRTTEKSSLFFLYLACILTYSHKSMKKEKDLFFPRSLYSLFISRETERERDYKNKTKK